MGFEQAYFEMFLQIYGGVAVFVGAFLLGEIAILTSFILATQSFLSYELVFAFSVTGMMCADLFWYFLGRFTSVFSTRLSRYKKQTGPLASFLEKTIGRRVFITLLVLKFLYGLRWITIMYFATRPVHLAQFFIFDLVGTFIFVTVLLGVGRIAGENIYNIIPAYHSVGAIILAILLAFFILQVFHTIFKKIQKNIL